MIKYSKKNHNKKKESLTKSEIKTKEKLKINISKSKRIINLDSNYLIKLEDETYFIVVPPDSFNGLTYDIKRYLRLEHFSYLTGKKLSSNQKSIS